MDCVSFVDRCFEGAFIQFKLTKMGGGGNRGRGGKWDEYGTMHNLIRNESEISLFFRHER